MLKAVRFDPEEHADIIKYVEEYKDKKGKPNHSEAIRLLMQKGLEALEQHPEPQASLDIESIKKDIFNQLMSQINTMGINQVSQQPVQQPVKQYIPEPEPIPEPVKQIAKEQPKPQPLPTNVNPLLANILGNANR